MRDNTPAIRPPSPPSLIATVAAIVVPIFGLIGLGWGVARVGVLPVSTGDALGDFVFVVALPLLLFRTIATAPPPEVSPLPYWLAYFGAVAIVWLLADQLARRAFGREARYGVIAGVSAGFANIVLVGLPFNLTAYGEAAATPLVMLIAIHLPVMMTAGTLLIERAARIDGTVTGTVSPLATLRRIALNVFRNPLIIGIIAGGAWRLTGWPLGALPMRILDHMAAAALPCALFALGMSLSRYGIHGNVKPAIATALLKIVLLPGLVWLFMSQLALPPLWVNVATLAAAAPTGVNAWLIATRFGTGHALSANTITLTTGLSVFSMGAWYALLGG